MLDVKLTEKNCPTLQREGKIESHELDYEYLIEDITGQVKKVRINLEYLLECGDMTITKAVVKKLESFVMSDTDVLISVTEALTPLITGRDIMYTTKIIVI